MDESEKLLTSVTEEKYKYGFTTNVEQEIAPKGLN